MKKKLIMALCVSMCCVGLSSCGAKESAGSATDSSARNEVTATTNSEPEQTQIPDAPSEIVESSSVGEEIFGDYDYFMTMDDMEVKTIGVDVRIVEGGGSLEDVLNTLGLESIKVLFPREAFCIDERTAECPGINMTLRASTETGGGNVAKKDTETVTNYGDYCLYTKQGRNSDIGFTKTYEIYLPNEDCTIMMELSIAKTQNEYQELADAFVEAYVPAFEEVLISNLQ